jgi:hypothetical protein
MVGHHQRRLVELATKHRLPHILDGLDVRQTGALMAYSESTEPVTSERRWNGFRGHRPTRSPDLTSSTGPD